MNGSFLSSAAIVVGLWLLLHIFLPPALAQPPDEESQFSIAAQAYQDGLLDLARDQLQTYLTTYPHGKHLAEVNYLLGDYFYRQANYGQAALHLQRALDLQPQGAFGDDARYLLGRSDIETGHYAEAIQAFQPLIERGEGGHWYEAALYWTGEALLNQGDFQHAAQTLRHLVERFPTSQYLQDALYSLGYAWQTIGMYDKGLQAFQELLQRFPQSKLRHSAAFGVARALVSLQRYAEAAAAWERLRHEAQSPAQGEEATFWWAQSWAQAGRCDQAKPAFEAYLMHYPHGTHEADAVATLGDCAHTAGAFVAAITHFNQFLQQFPDDPRRGPILLRLADAYMHTGQLAQAYERYSQWLAAFPDNPHRLEVLIQRGLVSRLQKDDAEVVQDFAAVLHQTTDPQQRALAHQMLAESYVRRNDCSAAMPHLSAVVAHGDQSAQQQARLQRGMCAYRNKHLAAAVEDFEALADDVAFHGDRQAVLLLLGQSLAALERYHEAIARFRQVLAATPTGQTAAQPLAGLGASLLKIGQVAEALSVYEQLLTVAPNLPDQEWLHLQLGLLYRQQQHPEEAKAHLQAAADGHDAAIGAEALYQLATILLEEGHRQEAITVLQKLTTQYASQTRWLGIAYYRLALTYEAAQQWPQAWEAYRAAAENAVEPKLVEAARGRAQQLEETVDVHARREPAPAPGNHDR